MTALFLMRQAVPLGSLWGDYVRTMVILIGICLLAFGALKFFGARLREDTGSFSGGIRVLSRQPLEPRKNLYVVRAGNTTMVIATSGESVHFMTQIEQSDFPEEQPTETHVTINAPTLRKFSQLVKNRWAGE
jgi:flagellar biogenesis protein FliO